jgi:hypothetical protein
MGRGAARRTQSEGADLVPGHRTASEPVAGWDQGGLLLERRKGGQLRPLREADRTDGNAHAATPNLGPPLDPDVEKDEGPRPGLTLAGEAKQAFLAIGEKRFAFRQPAPAKSVK